MNRFILIVSVLIILCILLPACHESDAHRALKTIREEDMKEYVIHLGSDAFQGRKPFSAGEKVTVEYLVEQFRRIGLEPGFGETYTQAVPMVEVKVYPSELMRIQSKAGQMDLQYRQDYVLFSRRMVELSLIEEAPVVFAGYGIVAPEYGWNDYDGVDPRDKIVVVLVNDPGYGTGDSTFFRGNAMTYYGRWTYKYEEAARQGALGLMIVHMDGPAGYSWSVVHNGAVIPRLYLQDEEGYRSRCAIEGWFTQDAARSLISFSDHDPDSLFQRAARPGFTAVDLGINLSCSLKRSFHTDSTMNVMGMIPGTERPDECIIYSAHWDHLGIGEPLEGDSIYNGAVDNGTSLAWMMEIAQAFVSLKKNPARTLLFLAPTAEEQGLLGAEYYVNHPVIPMEHTVANINNDLMLPMGRMRDVMITGYGQSDLEDLVARYAAAQDRYVIPDPNPQTGMYFRADHFCFARAGVPSLFVRGNCDHREYGKAYADSVEKDYIRRRYHRPTDEYDAGSWDLSGIAEDASLLFLLGYELANSDNFPRWKEGSEFKAVREQVQ